MLEIIAEIKLEVFLKIRLYLVSRNVFIRTDEIKWKDLYLRKVEKVRTL